MSHDRLQQTEGVVTLDRHRRGYSCCLCRPEMPQMSQQKETINHIYEMETIKHGIRNEAELSDQRWKQVSNKNKKAEG